MRTRPVRLSYPAGALRTAGAVRQMLALGERPLEECFNLDRTSRLPPRPLDAQTRGIGANIRHLGPDRMAWTGRPLQAAHEAGRSIDRLTKP